MKYEWRQWRREGGKRSFIMEEEERTPFPFFVSSFSSSFSAVPQEEEEERKFVGLSCVRVCVSAPPYLPRRSSRTRHNFFCVSPFSALSPAFDTEMRPQANKKRDGDDRWLTR